MQGKSEDHRPLPAEVLRAVELSQELKAHQVTVLDLHGISTATYYFVIASGNSDVQVKAIADHIIEELKKESLRPQHVEGLRGGRWVLLDYIEFVVHIFHPEARTFYQLENLWGDAPRWEMSEG
ncbi:MAG: ribosome silencing factor [Gemmatimonadetes bacterium]|nr:ribosome silencing factor [Gemmatimonadota bacterium]